MKYAMGSIHRMCRKMWGPMLEMETKTVKKVYINMRPVWPCFEVIAIFMFQ